MGLRRMGLAAAHESDAAPGASWKISAAIRTRNFWLMERFHFLVIGAINTVIQHFHLCQKDQGYSSTTAARYMSILLASSLGGAGTCGLYRRSLQEEKYNGLVLPVACSVDPNPLFRAATGCGSSLSL